MILLFVLAVQAASPVDGVGIDPKPGAPLPLELAFRDERGNPITLRDAAAGKPFILAPVYYRCPQLCTQIRLGLVTALKGVSADVGSSFQVVEFSFDPREDAALATERKAKILRSYGRPGTEAGWKVLTGDRESIDRLCAAAGYRTSLDARSGRIAHASAIYVVTPEGRISRTFFGIEYPSRDLRLALAEAADGKTGSIVDPVLLFCFEYDPATGRYGLAVMRLLRLGALATVLALGLTIAMLARRHRRRKLSRGP